MLKVALFIPCYVDSIYPNVAFSTAKILKNLGYKVEYPSSQTCCGQPFYNSGMIDEAKELAKKFYTIFKDYDYIVAPSASCISMVKIHYKDLLETSEFDEIAKKSFEICEFLHDEHKLKTLDVKFEHKISLHKSCHGLRELELGTSSELNLPYSNKVENLLSLVEGIEFVDMPKADECCGFGGTFSINESDISIKMAKDKIENFETTKADYFVGYDNSCMMHLKSVSDYDKKDIKYVHVVQILSGDVE